MIERASRNGSVPPLSLYVHLPWCVRKCPYCDFNSHVAERPPFEDYVTRLLVDLDREMERTGSDRGLGSIYLGGGTPSLFPAPAIRRFLTGVRDRARVAPDAEVTLEANPGTRDASRFEGYRRAGVNRLSIGAQSLSGAQLATLGRIHDPHAVRETVRMARAAGFDNLNLDLMFGLPGQSLAEAKQDLDGLLALEPEHLSYYQLTLEPNTRWAADPPSLPDGDLVADMSEQGCEQLVGSGYGQYEVSAHARSGRQCRHNLNYWRFGDYLGIGAGAHGKLTAEAASPGPREVERIVKLRHPMAYLGRDPKIGPDELIGSRRRLDEDDLIFELALNLFRLTAGFTRDLISSATGLPWTRVAGIIRDAERDGLLWVHGEQVLPTPLGRRFVDELVLRFAPVS